MVDQPEAAAQSGFIEPSFASPRQRAYALWLVHILVSVTVLSLAEEHADKIVIDSFTITLLTAIILRVALEGAIQVEHRATHYLDERGTARVLKIVTIIAILFTSKILILGLVDLIFGDDVELGGFLPFIALIIALMGTEWLVGWTFKVVGETDPARKE